MIKGGRIVNYIGIDPGHQGAIAVISAEVVFYKKEEGVPELKIDIRVEDIPVVKDSSTGRTVYDIVKCGELLGSMAITTNKSFAILELQHPFPAQGSVSNFSLGQGFMLWKVLLTTLNIPFQIVPPQKWMSEFSLCIVRAEKGHRRTTEEKKDLKKKQNIKLYETVNYLFPKVSVTTPRGRVMYDRCDALLLATYAKRLYEWTKDKGGVNCENNKFTT